MPRLSITAGLITSLALAAGAQVSSVPAFPDGTIRGGRLDAGEFTRVQECRIAATAATTRTKGPGFSAETTTACQFDKATNKSTCTNKYADSIGTSTTHGLGHDLHLAGRCARRDQSHSSPPAVAAHGYHGHQRAWLVDQ